MSAQLNLSTIVDKFLPVQSIFFLWKIAQAITLAEHD
jgi:hypothetical protein